MGHSLNELPAMSVTSTPVPETAFTSFFEPSPFAAQLLRQAITAACRTPEPEAIGAIVEAGWLPEAVAARAGARARQIAQSLRERKAGGGREGLVQGLLQEYALSSQEGIALMCLAEALLRIPDAATRDALIRDKIGRGDWEAHLASSGSLFVNAATWGLLLTGRLVATHSETGLSVLLGRLLATGGAPLIRKGVDMAMRLMGEQFVAGETLAEALARAAAREAQGFSYSFDMLGEAALTAQDAARYLRAYEDAIHAIGRAAAGRGVYAGPGISIKLSALHPRYSRSQQDRVMGELYPVLLRLCALSARYDIGLNIDAEEADRLELSLDLLERLCAEPLLQGWQGLGFVIQAYQKRCPFVVDFLIDLGRRSQRRLMVRLVKGAYWDSEIKRAQVEGQAGYPVYTRKAFTDAAYLACARQLLAAPEAVYPQFATHNAHTLAAIYEMADPAAWQPGQYEFQCLHGMGEPLYEQVVGPLSRPCRIYAPVGTHETLLAYLVRRLLENGANTSFVNQVADPAVPLEHLVRDPFALIDAWAREEGSIGLPHPQIPLPADLYGAARRNSRGLDLADESVLAQLARDLASFSLPDAPADASPEAVEAALAAAAAGAPGWAAVSPAERARRLDVAADRLEGDMPRFIGLLVGEAGKTCGTAVAEVREAVDFLRYYAAQARAQFDNRTHLPLGPVVCISPWNFPLAIFIGQVAAALAAGNAVLAKPAEQTPRVALEAVRALWGAGIARDAVQLICGAGPVVGARLVGDARVQGVLFTGSTEVARALQRALAGRLTAGGGAVPLIAETGGQNAMVVDSSALPEQVVADVIASAFDSAGQRCSALRVLCVQEEVADRVREMLLGAMAELRVGDPARLSTDVGPVIDAEAQAGLQRHIDAMRARGRAVHQAAGRGHDPQDAGTFIPPTLIEIGSIAELECEVFGPVLHFVRYRRDQLDALLAQVQATGYGLTMGLHTRIDETIARVAASARVGNLYVNRNMVGAVVGVQPFGGEGLSGTGPKAGGPLYLPRLLARCPEGALGTAVDGCGVGLEQAARPAPQALRALAAWAREQGPLGSGRVGSGNPTSAVNGGGGADLRDGANLSGLSALCDHMATLARSGLESVLAGPTGERNVYRIVPRERVLSLAASEADRLVQLAALLATGCDVLWPADASGLHGRLPGAVRARISLVNDWSSPEVSFDAVLLHGSAEALTQVQDTLAAREGPVVGVERLAPGSTEVPMERLVVERALSVNTAAAGGNASLMTIGDG